MPTETSKSCSLIECICSSVWMFLINGQIMLLFGVDLQFNVDIPNHDVSFRDLTVSLNISMDVPMKKLFSGVHYQFTTCFPNKIDRSYCYMMCSSSSEPFWLRGPPVV
ncbi:hypothetical protein AVEN_162111-1 [Araneus ventricosus]|uniref:Uncharacterized protein n=1 Tax=Araneus ventricosus TaxID=182803 RepID=A0A4Y2SHK7_ARAVE|nr:hypothetical protein AVEN_162111-1 [Araneus ventricosus]